MKARRGEAKRRRGSDSHSSDPLQTWATIRALNLADLENPNKVTTLSYPGIRAPSAANLKMVGITDLTVMKGEWYAIPPGQSLLLVGGKGVGKSVRLRALACILYATLPHKSRLVCIWNMDSIRSHLLWCMMEALLFTYAEEEDVVKELQAITTLGDLKDFFIARKRDHGEAFSFILDGAQALDVKTWYGAMRSDAYTRLDASLELEGFLVGCKTLWGLSPKASMVERDDKHPLDEVSRLDCDEGFDAVALQTYMGITAVGTVVQQCPHRLHDVNYYAGSYPWFLQLLDDCCEEVASNKESAALKAEGMEPAIPKNMTAIDIASLLHDQEDWDAVLLAFSNSCPIRGIRNSLQDLKISKPCCHIKDMVAADPRYVLDQEEGIYSSPYVESMYITAFRNLEYEMDKTERAGAWVPYCKLVLRQPVVNWAEIGWLCERLCTDVVSKMGIDIGDGFSIGPLEAHYFSNVPQKLSLQKLRCGLGYIYIPDRHNFGHVDGVIVYRDMSNQLHFIGLQFTTSEEKHRHSEDEFMNVAVIQEWIPSVVDLVSQWELHFVFVCLTSREVVPKQQNLCELKGGAYYGTLAHKLHVRSFVDALGPRKVGQNAHNVLLEMTARRELDHSQDVGALEFPPPPSLSLGPLRLSQAQLKKLRRAQLDAIALDGGLTPNKYRTIALLVEAMESEGLLHVE